MAWISEIDTIVWNYRWSVVNLAHACRYALGVTTKLPGVSTAGGARNCDTQSAGGGRRLGAA